MMIKAYSEQEWTAALEGLKDAYRVYVPFKDGDFYSFGRLEEVKRASFDGQNTRLSPKGLLYPQSMRMFEFTLDEGDPEAHIMKESHKDDSPQAVVGIHPCDAHAFELVNVNFDNPRYRDPWWVKGRERTTLVGFGCVSPCSTCFCTSVGGGPFDEKGLDVMVYPLGEGFVAKALTDKGEAFVNRAEGGGRVCDEAAKKEAEALAASVTAGMEAAVPTEALKDQAVMALFEAPFWEEVAFGCINCGTCTYLCPTCWCFDIQDEVLGKEGDRIRNWDSCMFPLFTLHGTGHNPRAEKVQRVRQRFMHKLKYYVDKYDNGVQCSGCGRCVRQCPVNIDIRRVAALMNHY
jgi:sulfhydrogenase subunit beta (sulfur reductase)